MVFIELTATYLRYNGSANVEVSPQDCRGKDHFVIFKDGAGREVMRETFGDDGRLGEVIISDYDLDGRIKAQEVYDSRMSFVRVRNALGKLEERNPEGELIRVLDED